MKDGGPAFPIKNYCRGLTIRDWFAGQALAGMLSDSTLTGTHEDIAYHASKYADAMLAERENNQ